MRDAKLTVCATLSLVITTTSLFGTTTAATVRADDVSALAPTTSRMSNTTHNTTQKISSPTQRDLCTRCAKVPRDRTRTRRDDFVGFVQCDPGVLFVLACCHRPVSIVSVNVLSGVIPTHAV